MRFSLFYLLFPVFIPFSAASADHSLELVLSGVKNDVGQIRAGLYAEPKSFRKEAQAQSIKTNPAKTGDLILHFVGLAPGRYAIMAYHDEDSNGELNRRFGMFPTEGYGLSNNPKVSGPPAFDDSAFDIPAPDNRLHIKLIY